MSAALSVIQTTNLSAHINLLLPSPPHLPNSSCYYPNKHMHMHKPRIGIFSTHCLVGSETATPTTSITSGKMPIHLYLMERLGFSEKEAHTTAAKVISFRTRPTSKAVSDLIYIDNADNVISFFEGCFRCQINQTRVIIKEIVRKHPRVLTADVEKTIKPKIELLQDDVGFSTSDLALALSTNPVLYLACDLTPAIQALRDIMDSDEDVVKVLKKLHYGAAPFIVKGFIPNVAMLQNEYGIPRDKLRKFLTSTPKALVWRTDWFRDVVVKTEDKWGISRDSAVFLTAVCVFSYFSDENINLKCQVFRSFGWSESDIKSFIRQYPTCMKYSVTKTKKALEFYMNELGYECAYIAARPSLLSYSLENRVLPRHKVLSILKEKELIKADYQLYTALVLPDDKFFEKLIQPFVTDVPELREVYING